MGGEKVPVMAHAQRTERAAGLAVLAILVGVICPAAADAGWLGLRNDTGAPIVVQGASLVNNVMRRGRPQLLFPGEVTWEAILIPGKKVIEIYDPKLPKHPPVHQEIIPVAGADLFYSIQLDAPPKAPVPAAVKFKFVPTKPPTPPPANPRR
jgi:hypothetical protein